MWIAIGIVVVLVLLGAFVPDALDVVARAIFLIIAAPFRAVFLVVQRIRTRKMWNQAALQLGYERHPGRYPGSMIGGTGDATIHVDTERVRISERKVPHLRVRAEVAAGHGAPLVIVRRSDNEPGGVRTGDDRFDAAFRVSGPESVVVAVLNDDVRDNLMRLIADGGSVRCKDGKLVALTPWTWKHIPKTASFVGAAQNAAVGLCTSESTDVALHRSIGQSELGAYRLRCFELLAERGSIDMQQIAAAAENATTAVRDVLGAVAATDTASLHQSAGDASASPDTRILSVYGLSQLQDHAVASAAIRVAAIGPGAAARTMHRFIQRHELKPPPDQLATLLPATQDDVAEVLLDLLAVHAGPQASDAVEQCAIDALTRTSLGARRSAVRALGAWGTTRAVEALRRAETNARSLPPLADAARNAITRIHDRLDRQPAPGGLSVAQQDGGLTMVEQSKDGSAD